MVQELWEFLLWGVGDAGPFSSRIGVCDEYEA